jgi:PhnB protein
MPADGGKPVDPSFGEKIMHMSLPISQETMIMGSDVGGEWASSFKQGNNFTISVNAGSKEEADRLFNGLSEGGTVTMPLQTTFWGDYFGMWIDKFGINWMISFAIPQHK